MQYTYDAEGRRTRMVDQSGFTTNYSYDAEGRLSGLTNGAGASIISYLYDAAGRLSKETNGNGTYTTYGYDAAGQLTGIVNRKADNTINSSFQYIYDTLGRQTRAVTSDGTWLYTYDRIGQLTRARFTSTNASIVNQDLQYTYDAAGNRTRAVVNGVTTNYAANNLNQYTTVGGATHTYDADGNLIQVVNGTNITSYTYNDENRLIGVTSPTGSWTYEYDAFGNRTASIQNGVRTEYLVDPFGLGDVVGEYSGGTAANYVHGLGLVGRFNGGNAAYYDSDFLGSTVGLTNSTGSYVNRYVYRPYGENLITTEGVANPFEYVGQWGIMDEANGLDFIRARFYSSPSGRFINPDPIGQFGGLNIYTYALNQPITAKDITGNVAVGLIPLVVPTLATALAVATQIVVNNITVGGSGGGDDTGRGGNGETSAEIYEKDRIRQEFEKALKEAQEAEEARKKSGGNNNDDPSPAKYVDEVTRQTERRLFDPVVLDLDGDGIELVSVEQSTAQFDLNADGFRELTGWVKADDGMLALDANGDGKINNITELFGDALTDGFIELKTLDSNNDNVINFSDTQFSQLRIWQDFNQDGITDAGELKTLTQLDVQSISLNTASTDVINEGNLIRTTSKYTRTDGTQRDIVALWFAADRLNTTYDQPYQLKPETLLLPTARGYGGLPDLDISMSLDRQLLGLMRGFVAIGLQDLDQVQGKTQDILFRWAEVDGVDPASRGQYFDARKLEFLEKFLQQDLNIEFSSVTQTLFVQQAWDLVVKEISARLLVQGGMRDLFPNATYSLNSDSLKTGDSLSTVLNRLTTNTLTDADSAAHYWSYAISILDIQGDFFNLTQVDYDGQIRTALGTSGLADYLDALRRPVFGGTGNDVLSVKGGLASFLDGGVGNDTLVGTFQNDIINGGAGNDAITRGTGVDLVNGGAGIDTLIDADFSMATNALTINDINNPLINLSDGTKIRNIERFFDTLTTGSGNDRVVFTARQNNAISTGAGNDTINAGLGYSDRVDGGAGSDLLIVDYSRDDAAGQHMYFVAYTGTEGSFGVVHRSKTDYSDYLDYLSFSDINRFNITGTSKDDTIDTHNGNDIINSGAGNDRIGTGSGNDLIVGGAGNDIINAGDGNDTVNSGDGDDTVDGDDGNNVLNGEAGTDKLILNLSAQLAVNITNYRNAGINITGVIKATNFEEFDITTGNGNDKVVQAGVFNGTVLRNKDNISTGAGNDTINAGLGYNDRVDGGAGSDLLIVDYSRDDAAGQHMYFVAYTGTGISKEVLVSYTAQRQTTATTWITSALVASTALTSQAQAKMTLLILTMAMTLSTQELEMTELVRVVATT